MADKKTKFDIFLENAEKIKSEFKSDKESFLAKMNEKKEIKTNNEPKKTIVFDSDNSVDLFSRIISKEKMEAILDKFKNKNK